MHEKFRKLVKWPFLEANRTANWCRSTHSLAERSSYGRCGKWRSQGLRANTRRVPLSNRRRLISDTNGNTNDETSSHSRFNLVQERVGNSYTPRHPHPAQCTSASVTRFSVSRSSAWTLRCACRIGRVALREAKIVYSFKSMRLKHRSNQL